MSRPRTICILTVGRSGSSLVARALSFLGLELGSDEAMYPADRHNVRGYWELREVTEINDEILAALGGSLWSPPPLPVGWAQRPSMAPLRRKAEDLIARARPRDRVWAFKDTRTVYTLPLWREILGETDYILCVRDPTEVVASLAQLLPDRDPEELMGLWIRANCIAIRETSGQRRLILRYDEWFSDPDAVLRRLGSFTRVQTSDDGLTRARREFDPSLRHQLSRDREPDRDDTPVEARTLDVVLQLLAGRDDPAVERLAHGLDSAYATRVARVSSERDRLLYRQAELETAARDLTTQLADRTAKVEELRAKLTALEAQHELARNQLAAVTGSTTWRLSAPARAARHGDARQALRELRAILRDR